MKLLARITMIVVLFVLSMLAAFELVFSQISHGLNSLGSLIFGILVSMVFFSCAGYFNWLIVNDIQESKKARKLIKKITRWTCIAIAAIVGSVAGVIALQVVVLYWLRVVDALSRYVLPFVGL